MTNSILTRPQNNILFTMHTIETFETLIGHIIANIIIAFYSFKNQVLKLSEIGSYSAPGHET